MDLESKNVAEYCLIYLPVFPNNPSENSISKDEWNDLISQKKAIVLSANDLVKWLDNTSIISPAINQFCQYFKKFLSEELMNNEETNCDLVKYLIDEDNNSALYSALTVVNLKEQLYESLVKKLIEQLENVVVIIKTQKIMAGDVILRVKELHLMSLVFSLLQKGFL